MYMKHTKRRVQMVISVILIYQSVSYPVSLLAQEAKLRLF